MSAYDDYNDSEEYPTYYSLTESGQPVLDRQIIREAYIKENQPIWKITGQQHRYLRKLMHISHYELAKCLGLSPSVILAFEEGQPVQRPRFVEGAYRAALTSVFYSYYYSSNKSYPKNSYPTFTLVNLVANLYCYEEISLKTLQELVDIPQVIDKQKRLLPQECIKSGAHVYVALSFYPYSVSGKCGISAKLHSLMFIAQGEPITETSDATADFADFNFDE